jgi:single-stranded DNA-binding protein
MSTSTDGGLDGMRAELRGQVAAAPRARFTPDGVAVWEFTMRLAAHWTDTAEVIVVRCPDERYADLQRWVVPGASLYLRGSLKLARWQSKDGRPRACLLLEAIEVMPLDRHARGSEPAALDYSRSAMPPSRAITPNPTPSPRTTADRAARVRALLDEES